MKRRTLTVLTATLLLALGTIGFATSWEGSLTGLFETKASAQEKAPEAPAESSMVVGTCDVASVALPIEVESVSPASGPTAYASLQAAFAAINAGTHQGTISVEVCFNSLEPAGSAVLNSNAAAPAAYTSVSVRPLADGLTISGAPILGRGLVELNAADSVTIDGDNPNTGGTNRNLTITNTAATTVNLSPVIRVAVIAAAPTADNITIQNLILNGNATARNAAAFTSTTNVENSSFGIYAGGLATGATTAPGPLTSVSTNTAAAGTTINNFIVNNNAVNACARGIFFNGAATSVSTGVTISNNTLGTAGANAGLPPYVAPATTVYTKGIFVAGTTVVNVTGNTLQNILSYVGTFMSAIELNSAIGTGPNVVSNNTISTIAQNGAAVTNQVLGINVASSAGPYTIGGNTITNVQNNSSSSAANPAGIWVTTAAASATIEKNKVTTVFNRNTGTFGAYGINLTGGSNITVRNNFVADVNHNMSGGAAFSATFSAHGIRVNSGTGHRIYHNSVNMFGALVGTATTSHMTSALAIVGTGQTGMDVRNNIFSNTMTGGTTSIAHVSIFLPTNSASAMTLTLNNNTYFSGPSATTQGIAQAGTTAGTGFYLASNFNAGATTPASNLRALTPLLGTASNDDASKVLDPLFLSPTDLHISTSSPAESAGANIATVVDDIDNEARPATPDMGADEVTIVAPGTLQLSSSAYGGNEGTTLVATVNRVAGSTGTVGATYTLTDSGATGGAACGVGVDYVNPGPQLLSFGNAVTSQPINVTLCTDLVTDPSELFTITLSAPTGGASLGSPTVAVVTITDVPPPFNGTYTVGSGGNYPSLTNAGGIFEAINLGGASANVTISIISDLTGETGTFALNEVAGGFTVTIQPVGTARTITGSNASNAIIRLNGADNVTIQGYTPDNDLVGGNAALRELTVINTNVALNASGIALHTGPNGAQNNVIKNVNVRGIDPATSFLGIAIGGAAPGSAGADNDGNRIENCSIQKFFYGIYAAGASSANKDAGTVITQNDLTGLTTDRVAQGGVIVFNQDGIQITENSIGGISSNINGFDTFGIGLGAGAADAQFSTTSTTSGGIINALVARNKINGIANAASSGYGSGGILVAGDTGGANTIRNNMITGVVSNATSPDLVVGIYVAGVTGSSTRLYHNSIALTGDRGATGSQIGSYGVAITGTDPTVELKNNIFYNSQVATGGGANAKSFAIGTVGTVFANLDSNYNDFWSIGANDAGFRTGGLGATATDLANLGAWQGAVADDANSLELDPLYINPLTNLHLNGGPVVSSPMLGAGLTTGGVTDDYDADPRPSSAPDIGADELVQADGGNFPSGTFYNARPLPGNSFSGNFTVTGTLYPGGIVTLGGATVTLACNGTVEGAGFNNYFIGNFRKDFCGPELFSFPVGTTPNGSARNGEAADPEGFTSEYSPALINVTAGTFPSSLTINVVDTWLPGLGQTSSISRYWNVQETGDLTADMTMQYLTEDVYGNEPAYQVFKWDGASTVPYVPGSVNIALDQFTATGVTSFSGWAVGVINPTVASADISGRVLTADGRPIANVRVIISGGSLPEPIDSYTGHLGYYGFNDLPAGESYVVTVKSRRFTFTNPTRIITLQQDVTGEDFIAQPQK